MIHRQSLRMTGMTEEDTKDEAAGKLSRYIFNQFLLLLKVKAIERETAYLPVIQFCWKASSILSCVLHVKWMSQVLSDRSLQADSSFHPLFLRKLHCRRLLLLDVDDAFRVFTTKRLSFLRRH